MDATLRQNRVRNRRLPVGGHFQGNNDLDNLQGRRILALEEHIPVADFLSDMLVGFGCEVLGPVQRISDALDLIRGNAVDAAIVDVAIKGEVTFAVADELSRRKIPYAFTSGNKTPESILKYARAPIITKPYSADYIYRVLGDLIASGQSPGDGAG